MGEYTVLAVLAAAAVVAIELLWFRTGLLRTPAYLLTMAVVLGFQVLVDGWLTKGDAPIVLYDDTQTSGVQFPWDIPVEDFLFGFALLTLVLLLWERAGRRAADDGGGARGERGVGGAGAGDHHRVGRASSPLERPDSARERARS